MKSLSFTRRSWNTRHLCEVWPTFRSDLSLEFVLRGMTKRMLLVSFSVLLYLLILTFCIDFWLNFSHNIFLDLVWVWRIFYSFSVDCSSKIKFHTLSGLDWCWYSSIFLVFHWNGNHDCIRKLQQVQEQLLQVQEYFVTINLFCLVFNSSRSYVIGYHF